MNLKSFIVASVAIHIIGGLALYFYYHPIILDPKPAQLKEGPLSQEPALKKQKPSIKTVKPLKKDLKPSVKAGEPLKKNLKPSAKGIKPVEKSLSPPADNFIEREEPSALESLDGAGEGIALIEEYKRKELSTEPEESLEEPDSKIRRFSFLKQKPGNPPLSYPVFARKLKMQGTVRLLFFVDERGLVEKIQLEKSSGHPELDNYVLRGLAKYQFLENQTGWVRDERTFVLTGEEKEYGRLRLEGGMDLESQALESSKKDLDKKALNFVKEKIKKEPAETSLNSKEVEAIESPAKKAKNPVGELENQKPAENNLDLKEVEAVESPTKKEDSSDEEVENQGPAETSLNSEEVEVIEGPTKKEDSSDEEPENQGPAENNLDLKEVEVVESPVKGEKNLDEELKNQKRDQTKQENLESDPDPNEIEFIDYESLEEAE